MIERYFGGEVPAAGAEGAQNGVRFRFPADFATEVLTKVFLGSYMIGSLFSLALEAIWEQVAANRQIPDGGEAVDTGRKARKIRNDWRPCYTRRREGLCVSSRRWRILVLPRSTGKNLAAIGAD